MNLSKYKWWGAILLRVIAKQQSKREQTHPVCLLVVEKYEKVESINTQNDYETTSKKNEQIRRKQTFSLCFVNVLKFQENKFKTF